ncbi:MAG TPA: PKD domain-containing protein, partial [Vicinamibacterales bacterium]|nr:PKD domain-containing protein [Vicinamibacterales bacterium]
NAVVEGLFFGAGAVPPSAPISVSAGGPYAGAEGSPITLTANASGGPSATGGPSGYTFAWDLDGSGKYATTGQSINYAFPMNGVFTVGLRATDAQGDTAFATTNVTVSNTIPTALAGGPYTASTLLPLFAQGSANDSDPAEMAAGFLYTWDFGDGTATASGHNLAAPSHVYGLSGTYTIKLAVTDNDGDTSAVSTASVTVSDPSPISSSDPRILLTPSALANLKLSASKNTPQWQAFKARLDSYLYAVTEGGYEASSQTLIADFALGYQALKDTDPTTANMYADKAIAIMKSGLNDYQKGYWTTLQFLARGDGSTTTYTLPNVPNPVSSFKVWLGPVQTVAVTHGATNGTDDIGVYYGQILKVSNTPDGSSDYAPGTDWQYNPNLITNTTNVIDWSPGGAEPAAGATYYVTVSSRFDTYSKPNTYAYTLSGTTLTFPVAPTTNQAIFVEYLYGTHAADYSSLAFQQTSAGDGGFNSILVDASYTYRYLGKDMAEGLDWLWNYPGLSSSLKSQAMNMLVRWSDYISARGYHSGYPASNYGASDYAGQMFTAIALSGGRSDQGSRLLADATAFRQTTVLPLLQNPSLNISGSAYGTLDGGFYSEGWSYGAPAVQDIILAGLAFEDAGLGSAAPEHHYATQVIDALLSEQLTNSPFISYGYQYPGTVYDGGDWYTHPAPFPELDLLDVFAAAADDPAARAYTNYIIQSDPAGNTNDTPDLLFRDPNASPAFWSTMPLQYKADGTGLITARADWSYNSTWMSFMLGNYTYGGAHQDFAPGSVQIQRGGDDLLINAPSIGEDQSFNKSTYSNVVVLDDNGDGLLDNRYAMGFSYGATGVVMNAYEAANNYVYSSGNYAAAYSNSRNPGGDGPATQLTRQVVYLRPDFIVVHDRAGTIKDTYAKQLRWHFLDNPTVSGNSFVESVGSSKLFGQTFSSAPLVTTDQQVTVGSAAVYQVVTQNANPTLNVTYTTAFQSTPSTTAAMVATTQVQSTDGRMEGVQMGNQLVLFGTAGPVDPTAGSITYKITGTAPVTQLLTDLQPGRAYQIKADGALVATLTASSQGTLSFSTTPSSLGSQTIVIT